MIKGLTGIDSAMNRPAKRSNFVLRAERALRRAARKLRAESKRTGIPLAVWPQKDAVSKKKAERFPRSALKFRIRVIER
jgi:hypothetical protein